jgi:hypothetical protein
MHEDILTTVVRLDETEAFLAVEPLYGSLRHVTLLFVKYVCMSGRACRDSWFRFEFWINSSVRRDVRGEAKSFGRSSIEDT